MKKSKYHYVITEEGKRQRWNLKCTRCGYGIKYHSDYICIVKPKTAAGSYHEKCYAKHELEQEKRIFNYTDKQIAEVLQVIRDRP